MNYLLIVLALLFVALMLYFIYKRLPAGFEKQTRALEQNLLAPLEEPEEPQLENWPETGQEPAMQLQVTYQFGDSLPETTLSINIDSEYMGEYGVAAAEKLGTSTPEKLAACELFLFDKADFHTVCAELASEYAYRDAGIFTRLSRKGQVVLAKPEKQVMLHTDRLLLGARLENCIYASDRMRPESYFQFLTIQISIWRRNS